MLQSSASPQPSRLTRTSARRALWGMVALLLLVTGLGARGLDADALWFDEVWSLYYAGGAEYGPLSVSQTLSRVAHEARHERTPPGYYVLLHYWGQAVGWTELGMRGLSLLGGLLAVVCTYRLGYDVTASLSPPGRSLVGLSAAVAVGLSAFFIHYLHELRTYSIVVTLSAYDLLIYWRLLTTRKKPGYGLQAGLVLGVALSLYFHYLLVLTLLSVGLYHLVFAPRNARWWRITLLGGLGVVCFLPWVWTFLRVMQRIESLHQLSMGTPQALETLLYVFSNGSVALLALLGVLALRRRGPEGRLIWCLSLAGLLGIVAVSDVYPVVNHVRYLIMLWPLLAVLVGLGVETLAQKKVWPGWILGIWMIAGLWNTIDPAFNRALNTPTMPWRAVRAELQAHGQPGDVVVFHAGDRDWLRQLEFEHYMSGLPERYSLMERIPGLEAQDEYYNNVRQYLDGAPRVWVGVDEAYPPNFRLAEFQRALAVDYVLCQNVFTRSGMRFDLYTHLPASLDQLPFRFGSDIRMQLLEPLHLSGHRLSVLAGWYHGADTPRDVYSVALHVVDSTGQLVAQADYGLPADSYACHAATITVPSGTYTLLAAVYHWQTGERLDGVNAETGSTGDRLSLGTFVVP